jgi:hypothetical protein
VERILGRGSLRGKVLERIRPVNGVCTALYIPDWQNPHSFKDIRGIRIWREPAVRQTMQNKP